MANAELIIIQGRSGSAYGPVRRRVGDERFFQTGNFCNLFDSRDWVVYDPSLPGAYSGGEGVPDGLYDEWMSIHRRNGTTRVHFGSFEGGYAYNSSDGARSPFQNPNWSNDAPALRRFVEHVLDTPSAEPGVGMTPVIFLDGGDGNPLPRIKRAWPVISEALHGLLDHVILVPAWEPEAWHDEEFSEVMRHGSGLFPGALWFFHGWPGRGVMGEQNNPRSPWRKWQWPVRGADGRMVDKQNGMPTDDVARAQFVSGDHCGLNAETEAEMHAHPDPYAGWTTGEAEFYQIDVGPMFSGLLYQFQRNPSLGYGCDYRDESGGCPYNRWWDYVYRCGAGKNGWRKLREVDAYEATAWYAFRHRMAKTDSHASEDEIQREARDVATMAKQVADAEGVRVGFGNGVPW